MAFVAEKTMDIWLMEKEYLEPRKNYTTSKPYRGGARLIHRFFSTVNAVLSIGWIRSGSIYGSVSTCSYSIYTSRESWIPRARLKACGVQIKIGYVKQEA
jgi:hypothetical protein